MNSHNFIYSIENHLTPLAPIVIPGIIKKQLELLNVNKENITPEKAKQFIQKVSDALELFIGPEGKSKAKKLMLKKLRDCCTQDELEKLLCAAS